MNQSNMLMNMLLGRLQKQNPQAFSQIQQLMNSGQSPQQILNQMVQSGQVSPAQVEQAKNMANQMQNSNIRRF